MYYFIQNPWSTLKMGRKVKSNSLTDAMSITLSILPFFPFFHFHSWDTLLLCTWITAFKFMENPISFYLSIKTRLKHKTIIIIKLRPFLADEVQKIRTNVEIYFFKVANSDFM